MSETIRNKLKVLSVNVIVDGMTSLINLLY